MISDMQDFTWGFGEFIEISEDHLIPRGDSREHQYHGLCWCEPYLVWERDEIFIWKHVPADLSDFWAPEYDMATFGFRARYRTELTKAAKRH